MPKPISQTDMEAVFALTDDLGIHRESITVLLARKDPGLVESLPKGQVRIMIPESIETADWVATTLRDELARLGYEELP